MFFLGEGKKTTVCQFVSDLYRENFTEGFLEHLLLLMCSTKPLMLSAVMLDR